MIMGLFYYSLPSSLQALQAIIYSFTARNIVIMVTIKDLKYGELTGDLHRGTVKLHQSGPDTTPLLTVRPSDVSTKFLIELNQPGARQTFLALFVQAVFSDIISVNVRD